MGVLIHCSPTIRWQRPVAEAFKTGLASIGIPSEITSLRQRGSRTAILLGTTLWRDIEDEHDYLLVDRASIGDPHFLQLVWNGHGRRGNHCVPDDLGNRAKHIFSDVKLHPWETTGDKVVLCGQTETYSPHYAALEDWYDYVMDKVRVTHFRKHPAGDNPTGLPAIKSWDDCGQVITLNSSVAIDAVINGHPIVTMDEQSLAWDVSSHWPLHQHSADRQSWLRWLAWTQWHHDEIKDGTPIKHLFEAL